MHRGFSRRWASSRSTASRCGRRAPRASGAIGDALVFLLPGNPVSCLCAYDFFAGRAIRLRGGRRADWPHRTRQGVVARKIVSGDRTRRLLPRSPGRWRGRAARAERRVDSFVDHARRRLRHRSRRERGLRSRRDGHRLSVRVSGANARRRRLDRDDAAGSPSDAVPQRRHARRGDRALSAASEARAARAAERAARRGARPDTRRGHSLPPSTSRGSIDRTSTASPCRPPTRTARWRNRRAALELNDEVLSPGIAPQQPVDRGTRDDDRDRRHGAARRRRRRDGRAYRRERRRPAARGHARRRPRRERQLCRHRHREGRNRAARRADADLARDRRARGGRDCRGARLSQTARRDPFDRQRDRRAGRTAAARRRLRFERGDHRRRSRRARRRAGAARHRSRQRRGALGGARARAAMRSSSCSPAARRRAPATSRTAS